MSCIFPDCPCSLLDVSSYTPGWGEGGTFDPFCPLTSKIVSQRKILNELAHRCERLIENLTYPICIVCSTSKSHLHCEVNARKKSHLYQNILFASCSFPTICYLKTLCMQCLVGGSDSLIIASEMEHIMITQL